MKMPTVSMIVAMTPRGVIGNKGTMPWGLGLPRDIDRFKELTKGNAVVMGPKTYKSIGKPLKERLNIVITQNNEYKAPQGVLVAHDPRQARELAAINGHVELFVIGGATVYASFMKEAERLFVTYVESDAVGDTNFPYWDKAEWHNVWDEGKFGKKEGDSFPTRFVEYSKLVKALPEGTQTIWRLPNDICKK